MLLLTLPLHCPVQWCVAEPRVQSDMGHAGESLPVAHSMPANLMVIVQPDHRFRFWCFGYTGNFFHSGVGTLSQGSHLNFPLISVTLWISPGAAAHPDDLCYIM